VGLAHDLILADGADRRIARPLVSKCSIGGNFRAPCDGGVSVQVSVIPRAREVRFVRLAPHRLHRPTPQAVILEIERLRLQRGTGNKIAVEVGVSPATVSRVLRRLGLNKLNALEPAEPVRRYERENLGELIHLDIKKLGRIGSAGRRITGRSIGERL
jgi:hypothetical protein